MPSEDALVVFLRDAAARPFEFGTWDCGRFVARWVSLRRGVEPGTEFVGHYSTAVGLARLLERRGGLIAHFDACLASAGVERISEPGRGDVAIVDAPEGPTGAIMVSATTSACLSRLHRRGFRLCNLAVLAAWRV